MNKTLGSLFLLISIAMTIIMLRDVKDKVFIATTVLMIVLGGLRLIGHPVIIEEKFFIENQSLLIKGVVRHIKTNKYGQELLLKDVRLIETEGMLPIKSRVNLRINGDWQLKPYDEIEAYVKVLPRRQSMNPSDMNYEGYLKSKGIVAEVRADRITIKRGQEPILCKIYNIIYYKIQEIFEGKDQGILTAIVLGDSSCIPKQVKEYYLKTGIGHLLALSGFHLGIITAIVLWISGVIGLSYNKRYMATGVIIWGYTFLTGAGTSLSRAAIVISILCIGRCLWEEEDSLTSLGMAAGLILYLNPLTLYQVGFQLSFAGVLGVIMSKWIIEIIIENNSFTKGKKLLLKELVPWIIITIIISPILSYHFYEIPLLATILNLLVIPIFSAIMIGTSIVIGIGFLYLPLARLCGGIIIFLLNQIEKICKMILNIPGATVITGRIGFLEIAMYYTILTLVIYAIVYPKYRRAIGGGLAGIVVSFLGLFFVKDDLLDISHLYVGQGDATLMITPNKRTILIDGGSDGKGEVIRRYLYFKGERQIDLAIISHFHEDHIGGVIELIEKGVPVKKVIIPNTVEKSNWKDKLRVLCRIKKIPIYGVEKNDIFEIDGIRITTLSPMGDVRDSNPNNHSIVCKVSYNDFTALFTGDIESPMESLILDTVEDIDVLKVPHHGSKTSTTEKFLLKTKAEYAIISCGIRNRYNHPNKEVINRINKYPIELFRTDQKGAIMLKTNGNKIDLTSHIE